MTSILLVLRETGSGTHDVSRARWGFGLDARAEIIVALLPHLVGLRSAGCGASTLPRAYASRRSLARPASAASLAQFACGNLFPRAVTRDGRLRVGHA